MAERHFLAGVNAYALDPELLAEAMETVAEMGLNNRSDFDRFTIAVVSAVRAAGLTGKEGEAATTAIHMRLSALSRVIKAGGGRGFWMPGAEPGQKMLDRSLVHCAATVPLIEGDGPVRFDEQQFQDCVLTTAKTEGRA